MYVKIMSGEDIADDDSRKGYRLIEGVAEVEFDRNSAGRLMVEMTFYDSARLTMFPEGNVYVLDGVTGDVISSMGVAPYHKNRPAPPTGMPEEMVYAGEPDGSYDYRKHGHVVPPVGVVNILHDIRDVLAKSKDEPGEAKPTDGIHVGPEWIIQVRRALDTLGVALTAHSHTWSPEERSAYEEAIRLLDQMGKRAA